MLAILVTHPIQYHVPLWQMLARDGRVPFEIWYLSQHGTQSSRDREFQQTFAWDLNMLEGYPHRFLRVPAGASPNTSLRCRVAESLPDLFRETKTKVLWVQGWQVAAYWQAVWAAQKAGIQVWLRGESNILKDTGTTDYGLRTVGRLARHAAKRIVLGQLFRRVDQFLCIGTANRELYRSYGVPEAKLHMAPYAVDNDRFRLQAEAIRGQRSEIRRHWGITENAFVVLFCGKFIPKKRPIDLIAAAQLLLKSHPGFKVHLLFVGSGEVGVQMRAVCNVVFDQEQGAGSGEQRAWQRTPSSELRAQRPNNEEPITDNRKPAASFAGFLNQTEISRAYVAADILALPSDYGETWGLVVNEAMASGLPCVISDRCGSARDLSGCAGNAIFPCGDVTALAQRIAELGESRIVPPLPHSFEQTVQMVRALYPAE